MPVLLWYFMRRVGGVIGGLWLALTALVVALEMLADLGGDPVCGIIVAGAVAGAAACIGNVAVCMRDWRGVFFCSA